MNETATTTESAPRDRIPRLGALWTGVAIVVAAAAVLGFAGGTVQDGTRRSMLHSPEGGGILWSDVGAIDGMSYLAYPVGIIGIIVLAYQLDLFGVLISGASAAVGLAIGLAVFFPFWSEIPIEADQPWFWQHAPWLLPLLCAAAGLVLLGCAWIERLLIRSIRRRRAVRRAARRAPTSGPPATTPRPRER